MRDGLIDGRVRDVVGPGYGFGRGRGFGRYFGGCKENGEFFDM